MSLATGTLNRKIYIDKRTGAVDSLNMPVVGDAGWELHKWKWANIKTPTGMSTIRSQAQGVDASINAYSFRVRYDTTILSTMRVRWNDEVFRIVDGGVRHDHAGQEWTDIVCTTGGNDG